MKKAKYTGVLITGIRDIRKANHNLRSKAMDKALINASLEQTGGVKNNTHLARLPALRDFARYIRQEEGVSRLNYITKNAVIRYGEVLKAKYESGIINHVTARDYLSHVNVALSQARGDDTLTVHATKELGYVPKSGIAQKDGSVPFSMHIEVKRSVSKEVALVMTLQREFGLRFREASLFNAVDALKLIDLGKTPAVKRGTKGGQARPMPVDTDLKYETLLKVVQYQLSNDTKSLIPSEHNFKSFQSMAWRETTTANPNYKSHGERKHFACQYYLQHVGVPCPVQAKVPHGHPHHEFVAKQLGLPLNEVRILDRRVRLALSKLLGHHRVEVTNAYLG
ncbi:hypothetical protein HJ160_03830 [Vibrio parahaemolyticus]|nr:hypothetical protein [Vibrio parahaemolyticus]